jgi:CubicO group peptidase (beta-lactamase class C family)
LTAALEKEEVSVGWLRLDWSPCIIVPFSRSRYPLTDHARQPMPAGGLFSTAVDCAVFCQMLMNGGIHHGQRLISEASIHALTSRQIPETLVQNYGFGLQVTPDGFGHGGAYATNMSVDAKHGLITIFMVQHAGFLGKGKDSGGAFKAAAIKAFSP